MYMRWIAFTVAVLLSVSGGSRAAAQQPPVQPPAAFAKESGCLRCHTVEKPNIGPAWRDVAARYKVDAKARERLIDVVQNGSKGKWTRISRGVPMPRHARRLTHAEIAHLVDWILTLDSPKP